MRADDRTPRRGDDERLTHVSRTGQARMVDVGKKETTARSAAAEAWVEVGPRVANALRNRGGVSKGNVLETARIAGILAAKRTPDLVPMCHPLALDAVEVDARLEGDRVRIVSRVAYRGRTGVEMEAMTAAAVAALTVYDMVKSAEKGIRIGPIGLLEKRGGKSGVWKRPRNSSAKPSLESGVKT